MKLRIKNIPKTTIILAIVCAIALILFIGAYAKKDAFSQVNLLGERTTTVESQVKDSDNDGLKDWEEDLYKTDYLNPDTDNDGYMDGEEINSGHNPLVKAPNDTEFFHPLPLGNRYNITQKILSDDVLNSVIDSYMSQKDQFIKDNGITSQEMFSAAAGSSTIQEMSLRAIVDAYPTLLQQAEQIISDMPEIFKIEIFDKDIKISEDNSVEAIKTYLSATTSFLKSDTFFLQEQSQTAISSAFNDSNFSKIDAIIQDNDNEINKVLEITVPSTWKEVHKQGLALTYLIRNIFVSFRDTQEDPLKAYVAEQELEKFPDKWNGLMTRAIDLAKQQGINLSL